MSKPLNRFTKCPVLPWIPTKHSSQQILARATAPFPPWHSKHKPSRCPPFKWTLTDCRQTTYCRCTFLWEICCLALPSLPSSIVTVIHVCNYKKKEKLQIKVRTLTTQSMTLNKTTRLQYLLNQRAPPAPKVWWWSCQHQRVLLLTQTTKAVLKKKRNLVNKKCTNPSPIRLHSSNQPIMRPYQSEWSRIKKISRLALRAIKELQLNRFRHRRVSMNTKSPLLLRSNLIFQYSPLTSRTSRKDQCLLWPHQRLKKQLRLGTMTLRQARARVKAGRTTSNKKNPPFQTFDSAMSKWIHILHINLAS